ncbi:hypothetical protein DFH08DRAFT_119982 [Mycena albidolilacea]|uniref:DUF6534 domain-containing protein n=1 Tax=Mycena albidolilacea TaxID=1033008 RepID=A0AAD6YYE2_9AGAR|nr:hypothetical protein DFH08DRAFT_119982 [Mycena albidolilacea]
MASPLAPTYGVAFVTFFLATILYGMGLTQGYLYFHWYPKNQPVIKTIVVCLLIFETMQIVLYFDGLYLNLIDNFGNPIAVDTIFWQDSAQLLFGYLSAFLVQMYFSYCIYILNPKNKFISAVIILLGLTSLGTAIAQTVRTVQIGQFSLLDEIKPIIIAQSASTLACDIVITTALIYTLRGKRSSIESSNSIIATLMINAVNRGALVALCAALNMILFLAKPGTFYFFLGLIPSGKLYMNSMLATLNTRLHLRSRGKNSQGVYSLDAISGESSQNRSLRPNHVFPNPGVIMLHTTTETDSKVVDGMR